MNKQQLASKIWESANKMRSKIEANEYKDYILGFIFYKFLSENELMRLKDTDFTEDDLLLLTEDNPDIVEGVQDECGYFCLLYTSMHVWQNHVCRDAQQAFRRQRAAHGRFLPPSRTAHAGTFRRTRRQRGP